MAVAALDAAPVKKPRAFKRSDVVFGFPFTPEEYKMWHGTVLYGWTRGPKTRAEVAEFVERKQQALAVGVRSGVAINAFAIPGDWFRERDPEWRDRIWKNYRGDQLAEPWVKPPDPFPPEKGRICTNHPMYLQQKFEQTELAMAVEPYAFHIDDPLGTATAIFRQGCFCKLCLAGFRAHLQKNVAPETLRALGINDLTAFDYGAFLRERKDRPLWYDFENFQLRCAVENTRKIAAYARSKGPATLLIGSNAPLMGAHIVFAPLLDYLCAEVGTDAKEKKFGAKPMLNYKMGESLGIAVAATGIYQDWVMLLEHDIPDLVRGWVAESYAMGGNFIVPHKEWGFIQPPGQPTQRIAYPAKVELIGPLYEFVRKYPELFDDYEAVNQVGLLYDYRATRSPGSGHVMPQVPTLKPVPLHQVCLELANAQIQFGMAVAGSEPFDHELTLKELERYPQLIVNEPLRTEGRQRALLEEWERKGKLIRWSGIDNTLARIKPLISTGAAGGRVWVFPRALANDAKAGLICHVLNRDFDPVAEKMAVKKDVTIRLDAKLCAGRKQAKCRMYIPGMAPREIPVSRNAGGVEVVVPELELWAVLRFE